MLFSMDTELPADDQPSGLGLIPVPDDWVKLPDKPFVDPAATAECFIFALGDPVYYQQQLIDLTTPESRTAWGDFTAAASYLTDIPNWGLVSRGQRPVPDVAYIAVLRDVTGFLYADGDVAVEPAAVISLVDRPELGGWLVHAMGTAYVLPENMPRGG
jgi:hypothetical protein